MDFHAALASSNQPFNYDGVLVALVLQPQGVFCLVDELTDALATITHAPDQMRVLSRSEWLPGPIRIEALHDFRDLVMRTCDHGVVARFREVPGFPPMIGNFVRDYQSAINRALIGRFSNLKWHS